MIYTLCFAQTIPNILGTGVVCYILEIPDNFAS